MAFSRFLGSAHRSPDNGSIHWRAPALMTSSFVVGIAFAIGHHAFYKSLQGTEVRSAPYQFAGWQITPQQLNTAGGTAFAFAVKASLVLAISTAYVQLFFRAIARMRREIACIDSWFSGLGDITSLFGFTTLWTQPLLAIIALTAWLLPIAAIITPATLSVTFDYLPPIEESHFVPVPAFASLKFAEFYDQGYLIYERASLEATRVVHAAAAAGSILPIVPPAVNASWDVTILAPRLACDHVNDTLLGAIKDNVASVFAPLLQDFSTRLGSGGSDSEEITEQQLTWFIYSMFSYMSWLGASEASRFEPYEMPFISESRLFTMVQDNATRPTALQTAELMLEMGLTDWARAEVQDLLFVAALPHLIPAQLDGIDTSPYAAMRSAAMRSWNLSDITGLRKAIDWAFEEATVIRCKLVPSEYNLHFSYDGPSQEQKIESMSVADVELDLESTSAPSAPAVDASGCFFFGPPGAKECEFDADSLYRWSYWAMRDLFANLVIGAANLRGLAKSAEATAVFESDATLAFDTLDSDLRGRGHTYRSRVMSTSLADTIELESLNRASLGLDVLLNNRTDSIRALNEAASLIRPTFPTASRKTLKDAIEELFFNVSISMASSPLFAFNITAPNAPENVTVTIKKMGNIYSYSADKLWLAYGLAIGIALVNVGLGLLTMFRTGASFTLNFSTIVRATKNANISVATDEQRRPGQDPLPKDWKRATFEICPSTAYEVNSLKSGAYSSVDQVREESDRLPRQYDELRAGSEAAERDEGNLLERTEERWPSVPNGHWENDAMQDRRT